MKNYFVPGKSNTFLIKDRKTSTVRSTLVFLLITGGGIFQSLDFLGSNLDF